MLKPFERVSLIVIKSFQACGISFDIDGTHDGEIHCLKAGGAHETITMETAKLLSGVSKKRLMMKIPLQIQSKTRMSWRSDHLG